MIFKGLYTGKLKQLFGTFLKVFIIIFYYQNPKVNKRIIHPCPGLSTLSQKLKLFSLQKSKANLIILILINNSPIINKNKL